MRCVLAACALLIGQNCLGADPSDGLPDSPDPSNPPNLPLPAAAAPASPAGELPTPPPPPEFPAPTVPDLAEELPNATEALPAPAFGVFPGFTRDSTAFDYPFWIGFGAGFSSLSGTRALPPGFNPLAAERFPAFNQPGLDGGLILNAGLTYQAGGFGALTLGYRVMNSEMRIAQATLNGSLDPLVINFLNSANNNNDDGSSTPPRIVLVPDEVGSCLATSELTLHQLDLSWSTPPVWMGANWSVFAQVGARAAWFLHEDSTTSLAIFQQAKERFSGVGPVGGISLSCLVKEFQCYCTVDAGELFGSASQLDREMAILKHSTRIISDFVSRSQNVPMLGVEAGVILFSSDRVCFGIDYRFDQWWNVVNLRGATGNWSNHAIGFQCRWRL